MQVGSGSDGALKALRTVFRINICKDEKAVSVMRRLF